MRLTISLFGPFQVLVGDKPAAGFASDKVRALLAFLACETDRPHRREFLAGLLWPESSERAARASLRNALANLRRVIGDRANDPPCLTTTHQSVQFNRTATVTIDLTTGHPLR